jgi:5'-3' exoribonuclease 2
MSQGEYVVILRPICKTFANLISDGVAPRAKMNQQRSRRFRSAMDAKAEEENKIEFHKKLIESGKAEPGSRPQSDKKWDSNVITPGTPFMFKLSQSLRYWVSYKLNTDPGWAKLKVIISDASVPGEGEHKMMEFIRSQRRSPEHDPNTRHVIYGLDADLIMLGLATHEPHFRILREDVFAKDNKKQKCSICGQGGHFASECKGVPKEIVGDFNEQEKPTKIPYVWLHVSVLREYLELELKPSQPLSFKWDLERAIDDYVFLCFFVGNDFLPHLPSLEIREEGIDTLIQIWKESIAVMGGYVSKDGYVDLEKAQYILNGLAKREAGIFKKRREIELSRQRKQKQREEQNQQRQRGGRNQSRNSYGSEQNTPGSDRKKRKFEGVEDQVMLFAPGQANSREVREVSQQMFLQRQELFQAQVSSANTANKSAAAIIKEQLLLRKQSSGAEVPQSSESQSVDGEDTIATALGKRKAELMDEAADDDNTSTDNGTPGRTTPISHGPKSDATNEAPADDVKLWEPGYEDRYYERKFHVDKHDTAFRRSVAAAYVEGVQWVLLYYMQGCPAWQWYYPYHYAPFAADFLGLKEMKTDFKVGTPFRPYEQLMGVFPADSRHAIPEPFRSLMTDEDSPIIDFYPPEFDIDLNGKKFNWQGVAILPFVDEKRLLDAMGTRYPQLTSDEVERNAVGQELLLFSHMHPMYDDIIKSFYSKKQGTSEVKLNSKLSEGLSGKVVKIESYMPNGPLEFPLEGVELPGLSVDNSLR